VDVRALGCHAYAASGHKWLMGPKGTGLLYVSPDAVETIQPIQAEDGRRFLSESVGMGCLPLAVGLGAAIEALQGRAWRLSPRAYPPCAIRSGRECATSGGWMS